MDGGGVLMIQALHTIDIMEHIMGPVESVFARTATATHPQIEVEDVAVATLTFESGGLGTITATTSAFPGLSTRLEIFGEDGSAVIEDDRLRQLSLRPHREAGEMFAARADNLALDEDAVEFGSAHHRQLVDMLDAIRHDREPEVNGEESLKVLKLILALYESAQTGKPVTLDH
jgi:predicted dehydrogenase